MAPMDIADSLLKGWQHFIDLGPLYLPFTATWVIGCRIAGLTRNERYHSAWAIVYPIAMASWMYLALLRG